MTKRTVTIEVPHYGTMDVNRIQQIEKEERSLLARLVELKKELDWIREKSAKVPVVVGLNWISSPETFSEVRRAGRIKL